MQLTLFSVIHVALWYSTLSKKQHACLRPQGTCVKGGGKRGMSKKSGVVTEGPPIIEEIKLPTQEKYSKSEIV